MLILKCGMKFASTIDKAFMDEMVDIVGGNKGTRNAQEALQLIQKWGREFEESRKIHLSP